MGILELRKPGIVLVVIWAPTVYELGGSWVAISELYVS